ncbi:hypothetical protein [Paenibacillus sp. CF384]|uniref:hypothetical protein n=1 Tax=Paenibacillus sp. CF384 TaxID=1884382 RepID=UPI00089A2E38|nr:hypothetical protein [Paenibacillus sp. CF384]SDW07372.1 hypothetical protein SAMN05518855_1001169 [Paenibacillus sp. CF384]
MSFAISDWVQGRTKDGELIQGFITAMNETHNIANVYVVQSDHDAAVGTTIAVLRSWLKEQPTVDMLDYEEPILDFIELALATHDEEWFAELMGRMQEIRKQASGRDNTPILYNRNRSRLGRIIR